MISCLQQQGYAYSFKRTPILGVATRVKPVRLLLEKVNRFSALKVEGLIERNGVIHKGANVKWRVKT